MKGAFICLPRAALSDKRLGFEDLRVLLALWSWRGKSYTVHPTLAMIAERARVSAKHISGVTTKLARLGYIVKTGNGGRGQHVRYTLLEPETSPDSGVVYSETSPDSGEVCEVEARPSADGKTSPDSGEELQNVPRFRGGLEQNVPRSGGETSPASGDPIKETSLRQESAKADVPPLPPTKPKRAKREPMQPLHCSAELGQRWIQNRRETGARVLWNENTQARHDSEAAKAGITPEAAYIYAMQRGWQAFHARLYLQDEKPQQNGYKSAAQYKEEKARRDHIEMYGAEYAQQMDAYRQAFAAQSNQQLQLE